MELYNLTPFQQMESSIHRDIPLKLVIYVNIKQELFGLACIRGKIGARYATVVMGYSCSRFCIYAV